MFYDWLGKALSDDFTVVYKRGNPYHDEEGKFTTPERAVPPRGSTEEESPSEDVAVLSDGQKLTLPQLWQYLSGWDDKNVKTSTVDPHLTGREFLKKYLNKAPAPLPVHSPIKQQIQREAIKRDALRNGWTVKQSQSVKSESHYMTLTKRDGPYARRAGYVSIRFADHEEQRPGFLMTITTQEWSYLLTSSDITTSEIDPLSVFAICRTEDALEEALKIVNLETKQTPSIKSPIFEEQRRRDDILQRTREKIRKLSDREREELYSFLRRKKPKTPEELLDFISKIKSKSIAKRQWRLNLPSGMPREPGKPREVSGPCSRGAEPGNACHDDLGRFTDAARAVPPKEDERAQQKRESAERRRRGEPRQKPGPDPKSPFERFSDAIADINVSAFNKIFSTKPIKGQEHSDDLSEPEVIFEVAHDPSSGKYVTIARKNYAIKNDLGIFEASFVDRLDAFERVDDAMNKAEEARQKYEEKRLRPSWHLAIRNVQTDEDGTLRVEFEPIRYGDSVLTYFVTMHPDDDFASAELRTRIGDTIDVLDLSDILYDVDNFDEAHLLITEHANLTVHLENWRQKSPAVDEEKLKKISQKADTALSPLLSRWNKLRRFNMRISNDFLEALDVYKYMKENPEAATPYLRREIAVSIDKLGKIIDKVNRKEAQITQRIVEAQKGLQSMLFTIQKPVIEHLKAVPRQPAMSYSDVQESARKELEALGMTPDIVRLVGPESFRNILKEFHKEVSSVGTVIASDHVRRSLQDAPQSWLDAAEEYFSMINPRLLKSANFLREVSFKINSELRSGVGGNFLFDVREINLSPRENSETIVHEITHALVRYNHHYQDMGDEWMFERIRRSGETQPSPMKDYPAHHLGYKDYLLDEYIGRVYDKEDEQGRTIGITFREIYTRGVEALFDRNIYNRVSEDYDYMLLIYGFLRGF